MSTLSDNSSIQKNVRPSQGRRRMFEGVVARISSAKTICVLVKVVKFHPKYRKQYRQSRLYPVHDGEGRVKVGDTVVFAECRPISRTKRWRLVKKLETGN